MMVYTDRERAFYQFCIGYYKAAPSTTVKGLAGAEAKEQRADYTPQFLDEEIVPTSEEIIAEMEAMVKNLTSQVAKLKEDHGMTAPIAAWNTKVTLDLPNRASPIWGGPINGMDSLTIVPNTKLRKNILIGTDKYGYSRMYCMDCYRELCRRCNSCHPCDQGVNCEKILALGNAPQELP
jgi:hypothetical protein